MVLAHIDNEVGEFHLEAVVGGLGENEVLRLVEKRFDRAHYLSNFFIVEPIEDYDLVLEGRVGFAGRFTGRIILI